MDDRLEMDRVDDRRTRAGRLALLGVLTLGLAVAIAYALSRQDVRLPGFLGSVQEASGDVATSARVKAALALSQRVSAFDVAVDSDDGAVVLRGMVPSEEVRDLAGGIAAEVSGVRQVHNALVVDPATQPDREIQHLAARIADLEIETTLQRALHDDPAIGDGSVRAMVADRAVTLEGRVAGPAERFRAEVVARSVPGVAGVENLLTLPESSPDEAAERLARAVEFELYSARAFDLAPLGITADGGTVKLTGVVRSRAERLLAGRIAAEVSGVERVVNELAVSAGGESATGPQPQPPPAP